jgi:hypothetical protein
MASMRALAGLLGAALLCLGCGSATHDGGGPGGGGSSAGSSAAGNASAGNASAGTSDGSGGSASGSGGANAQAGSAGANSQAGSAGSSSEAGSGGSGGTPPSDAFVNRITSSSVNRIDLLFMIDNSVSMADKQEILKSAVPVLLNRLVLPICVDGSGNSTGTNAQPDGTCPPNSEPEFKPIDDIHIGIVSSSLGAHGGTVCAAPSPGDDPTLSHLDDQAHLIATERTGVTSYNNTGFLAWDPSGTRNSPPGENSAISLNSQFAAMVEATGEHGCGYEASLESWYRFLVDPEPPASVAKVGNATVRQGLDSVLLAQRAAFLRPDSLVAIVMLTDENDCSIRDDGVGWFVGATSHMPKATAPCALNPNDPCCRSCAQNESAPPAGCLALSADPVCMGAVAGTYNTWDNANDSLNLRCYDQKQRFGFDLLYETQRYVTALTSPTLTLQSDPTKTVVNPLYAPATSGGASRDPSLVFLAGIVGVPWQDIATADSLTSPTALTYLSATELVQQGRWAQLLGNPTASPPVPPSDPFMIETYVPRQGTNPNVPVSIVPPTSMDPAANAINGHEQNVPATDDLQYACTFKLATPKACAPSDAACDCSAAKDGTTTTLTANNSPLCQPPGGGAPGTTQYYAKAYPGARELTVLRDIGSNGIVASICPKVTVSANPSSDPNYGYNPAVDAIVNRLKQDLSGKCLPRALPLASDTQSTACNIAEVQKAGSCDCGKPGRSAADAATSATVLSQLQQSGSCGNAGQPSCESAFCICEIVQETGPDLAACLDSGAPSAPGFCYLTDPTSTELSQCPNSAKRSLRFVETTAAPTPAVGAVSYLVCPASQ